MSRCLALAVLATIAGCTPLPPEPVLGGPIANAEVDADGASAPSAMREVVWMNGGTLIRISRGERMCHEDKSSSACVKLSPSDRRELDRFFSNETFRARWGRYKACREYTSIGMHAFAITYADGQTIGRQLDAPFGSALTRECDRATRDAVVAIEGALVDRYLR